MSIEREVSEILPGSPVGYPSSEDGEMIMRSAKVISYGGGTSRLDFGGLILVGAGDEVQRVLPGMESEILEMVSTNRKKHEESYNQFRNPNPNTLNGRWTIEVDKVVLNNKNKINEFEKSAKKGSEHGTKAIIAYTLGAILLVGGLTGKISPLAGFPFMIVEYARQRMLAAKYRGKIDFGGVYFQSIPSIEEVEEKYQASLPKPSEYQLELL